MDKNSRNQVMLRYILLPVIFFAVALLGGLRIGGENKALVFLAPELICLVFAAGLMILAFRSGLLSIERFFPAGNSALDNVSNAVILLALFAASTQIFNSLLPEKGLLFWIVGFFFFWTLWNNLFVEFSGKRLLQSLGSMFGLAFLVKYLVIASLASTESTLTQKIFSALMKEASFGLLDLPRFAAATGYIQFFALALYLLGLTLLSAAYGSDQDRGSSNTSSESIS